MIINKYKINLTRNGYAMVTYLIEMLLEKLIVMKLWI